MGEQSKYYENLTSMTEDMLHTEPFYQEFVDKLKNNKNSFYVYNKNIDKEVDVRWVEAIEDTVIALDNVVRNPKKFMEQKEELLPMELSRNITPDSMKHLSQHTYLINSIDEDGTITPSKIMNYIKEETLQTYENKFINTLINKLFYFIESRYVKICDTTNDENIGVVQFDSTLKDDEGGHVSIKMIIEAKHKVGTQENEKDDLVKRVERLRNIIMNYKNSQFVREMGESYIKPPVMRTNAILRNPDYKQCLVCWQYIQTYDKIGYDIQIHEETRKPSETYMNDIYKISAINYGAFKHFFEKELNGEIVLHERTSKRSITPKFVKKMLDNLITNYQADEADLPALLERLIKDKDFKDKAKNLTNIQESMARVVEIEKKYYEDEKKAIEQKRQEIILEKQRQIEEKERRRREAEEEEKRREREEAEKEERRKQAELEAEERRKQVALEEEQRKQRELEEEQERIRQIELAKQRQIEREKEEARQKLIQMRQDNSKAVGGFLQQRKRPNTRNRR